MARKKPHEEHVNHERWLVSYADFITLLFAFFVVMYSISELDKRKMMKVTQNIQFGLANKKLGEDENPFAFFDEQSNTPFGDYNEAPNASRKSKSKEGGKSENKIAGNPSLVTRLDEIKVVVRHLNQLKRQIHAILISQGLRGNKLGIEIELTDDGLRIRIPGRVLFKPGKAQLKSGAWDVMQDLTKVIAQSPLPTRIDGHESTKTDDSLTNNDWELSLLRASALLRFLVRRGNLDPARIIAAGHGAHRPLRNVDENGADYANERYEIVILANADFTKGYVTRGK